MKFLSALAFALTIACLVPGSLLKSTADDSPLRTFTNDKGQMLEARVKGVPGDSVTLVIANGQEFIIQTSTLSATDQEFLKSMAAVPAPAGPAAVDSE